MSGNAFMSAPGAGSLAAGSLNCLGGGFSRVPFQPVSNLNLDRTYRVDARLSKKLIFGERFTAYLTFEAINLFNTPYDFSRRTAEYDLSGASLTGAILKLRSDYALPSGDALSPDRTTARRSQVRLRVTFMECGPPDRDGRPRPPPSFT